MSTITLKKINNEVIKPMKISGGSDTRPVLGESLFAEVYANIFLCARKKSGKTCAIQTILKQCSGRNTTILAFVSTVNKDSNWIAIKKWAAKHKIAFEGFPSIKEHKIDFLDRFLHRLEDEAEEDQIGSGSDSEEERGTGNRVYKGAGAKPMNLFGDSRGNGDYDSEGSDEDSAEDEEEAMFGGGRVEPTIQEKRLFDKRNKTSLVKRDKYQAPEYIIVMDDLSHELKLPSVVSLLKKNRHYKLKIIVSSQYLNDLKPESIRQLDYVLLFKGQTEDKIEKIRKECDLSIDQETLIKVYNDATKADYGFLYVDVRNDAYRKCFDHLYTISTAEKIEA